MADFEYKVTKYDPRFYGGPGGAYTRDEWTAYSDIGKSFDGTVLTRAEYERIEDLYLRAVRIAAEASGVEEFQVLDVERHGDVSEGLNLVEGQRVGLAEAIEICRNMLRENGVWCTLEADSEFYVHVGFDYYMYIGTSVDVSALWQPLEKDGLFVESNWPSPYLDE